MVKDPKPKDEPEEDPEFDEGLLVEDEEMRRDDPSRPWAE